MHYFAMMAVLTKMLWKFGLPPLAKMVNNFSFGIGVRLIVESIIFYKDSSIIMID
jgi:hypothetical protein